MSAPGTHTSKRICQIIKLKPESVDKYTALHANPWPSVLAALAHAHITNYTIHYAASLSLLVAHFTYTGSDWDLDMSTLAEDSETRRWWALTDGMQESFNKERGAVGSGGEVEWWTVSFDLARF